MVPSGPHLAQPDEPSSLAGENAVVDNPDRGGSLGGAGAGPLWSAVRSELVSLRMTVSEPEKAMAR